VQEARTDTAPRSRSPELRIWQFTGAVAVVAIVLVLATGDDRAFIDRGWNMSAFVVLLSLFALAEIFSVHLHFTKNSHSVSLFEVPLTLGLFFAPTVVLVMAHAVGAFLALVFHRRQKPLKLVFNLAQFVLGDRLAVHVFRALAGDTGEFSLQTMAAAGAGVLTASLVSAVLVTIVVSISEGRWIFARLASGLSFNAMTSLVATSLALTGVAVITAYPESSWLLIIPTVGLYLTNHAYARERRRHQGIEFLHDSTRLLHQGPELETALVQLVNRARDAFRAGFAELVYLPADGERALDVVADSTTVTTRSTTFDELGLSELIELAYTTDEPILIARGTTEGPLGAFLGLHGLADAVIAPLRGEERHFGILAIGNRRGDVVRFDGADVALWETLAVNVAAALENGHLEQSIDRLQQLEERLVHQASHDALTQLPNRTLLLQRVSDALDGDRRIAILFIDLDDFKTVNDSLGHAAGDELLMVVARRLAIHLPPGASAARLGGDEFAVLLPTADDAVGVSIVAEQLLAALGTPIPIAGRAVPVRASVGVALSSAVRDASELLRNADVAMYSAKRQGKNRVAVFEPWLHEEAMRRYALSADIDRAIRENEFVVHFQPIVELTSRQVVGAEALMRWHHPVQGLLPASDFIGIAEESDVVVAIRRIVIDQVCAFLVSSAAAANPVRVWVNLSTRDLLQPALAADLASALREYGVDASLLVLEVTEGLMIADPAEASRVLNSMRALGAQIALDDFGTGYSSLSTLRQLPVDILKIGKPFIDDIDATEASTAFVEAIIRLGQALGLTIVAEGIEHGSQVERLIELGCPLGQGYLFASAVTAEELHGAITRIGQSGTQPRAEATPATRSRPIGP
jgi:diguanylate cyclase (GGDEF)-like protein